MKNFKIMTSALLLSAMVLFSASFARADRGMERTCPAINASLDGTFANLDDDDKIESCSVTGPDDYMCGWLSVMDNALDCCEENLAGQGVNCQYWGTNYQYASQTYTYPTLVQKSAAYVNGQLSAMSLFATSNRPNPSGNWMIDGITLTNTTCGSGNCCLLLEVTYRKIICGRRK